MKIVVFKANKNRCAHECKNSLLEIQERVLYIFIKIVVLLLIRKVVHIYIRSSAA